MDDAAASQQLIDESKRANPAYDDQKPSQLSAHDTPASALTRHQKRKRRNRRNRQKKRESKETNENQRTSPEEDDKTSKQDDIPESSPVRFAETQPEADKIVSPAGEASCMLPGLGDIQGGPSEVAEDVTPAPAKKRKIGTPKSAITVQDLMETDPFEDSNSPPTKKTKLKRVKKPQTPTTILRDIYDIPNDEMDTANGSGEAQLPPVNDAPVLSGEERGADLQKNSYCNENSASRYKTVNNSKVYDWAAPVRKLGELPSDDEEIMRSPLPTDDEVSADALYKADSNEKKTPKKRGRPRKSEMSETEKSKKRRRSSTRDDEVEDGGPKQDHINGSSDPLPPKKKRGRPRKSEIDTADAKTTKQDHTNESSDLLPPKKKRGRPRKSETNKMEAEEPQHDRVMDEPSDPLPPKRKRGRPRKSEISKMEDEEPKQDHVVDESNALLPPKRKRGRPRKSEVNNVDADAPKQDHINGSSDLLPPKRKRGRPRKSEVMEAKKSEQSQGPKKQMVDEGLEARQDEARQDESQQNEVEDGQEQDDEVASNQSPNGTDNGAQADDSEAGQGSEQECAEAEDRGSVEVEKGPSASSRSAPGVDEMLWGDKFDLIFKLQDRRDELEEDIDWEDVRAAQGYPWTRETLESALHGLIQNLRDNGKEVDMDDFAGTVDDVMDFICAEHGTKLEEHYKAF